MRISEPQKRYIFMKVLVAMSGGVDSSVAAKILTDAGNTCVGCTMKLYNNEDAGIPQGHTCCSLDDVEDARSVAKKLGMPYFVFNFSDDFKEKVVNRFIDTYSKGMTPNPCIDCNRFMKFDKLFERADILECDCIATGHYARIEKEKGKYVLKKAVDPTKDQSYVLYAMTQAQLARTLFPLGSLHNTETRKLADVSGFVNAEKPDSQDICFVPDGDYAKFIRNYTGKDYPSGVFTDKDGKILGKHKGIIGYTKGQRKGLGISSDFPLYVCDILPDENRIVLGHSEDLFTKEISVRDVNFIAFENPPETFRAKVKIRYRQPETPATVFVTGNTEVKIVFDEPQRAATKGQAAVFYDGDTVLGGGVIC